MSLRETFARGFVWKLAGLLALAAFGWFAGIGDARAQTDPYAECYGDAYNPPKLCPDKQVAYENALRVATMLHNGTAGYLQCAVYVWSYGREYWGCTFRTGAGANRADRAYYVSTACPAGTEWDEATKTCKAPCTTDAPPISQTLVVPAGTSTNPWANTPTAVCYNSCEYWGDTQQGEQFTVDGVNYVSYASMTPQGTGCAAGTGSGVSPPSDGDGDGVSDGNDSAPANPGQGAGGGGTEPSGEDGGQPGEGSGNGNTSAGGGDCQTPPNSHGDQIGAQIAYQAWATRCAIEGAKDGNGNVKTTEGTGTGTSAGGGDGLGTCAASEVGTVMCAMKTAVESIKGFVDGLGSEAGTLDTSEGEGDEPGSVWEEEEDEIDLDESGLGWGGSCPQLPVITVGNYSGQVDGGKLCEVLSALGALILLLAYFQAAIIIGR